MKKLPKYFLNCGYSTVVLGVFLLPSLAFASVTYTRTSGSDLSFPVTFNVSVDDWTADLGLTEAISPYACLEVSGDSFSGDQSTTPLGEWDGGTALSPTNKTISYTITRANQNPFQLANEGATDVLHVYDVYVYGSNSSTCSINNDTAEHYTYLEGGNDVLLFTLGDSTSSSGGVVASLFGTSTAKTLTLSSVSSIGAFAYPVVVRIIALLVALLALGLGIVVLKRYIAGNRYSSWAAKHPGAAAIYEQNKKDGLF